MVRVTTKIEEKNEFKKRDNTNSMFYFEPADGEYCDVYYLKIMEDDVDDYVWQMLDELYDEYGLSREEHYTEGDYEVWELI